VNGEVIIALGSNLGDPAATIRAAFTLLDALAAEPVRRSSLWQSTPVDCPPGSPLFVNAVALLTPRFEETPESLLEKLQQIERDLGRQPKQVLNEARPLDLDLIAWDSEIRNTPTLILPHPRAHLRRFVMEPLAELAPDLVLSGQSQPVAALLANLPPDPAFRRLA
jgi:2-amino-4-hydroxy-6-hydroxymethyldihydropteridine diphosphokinase